MPARRRNAGIYVTKTELAALVVALRFAEAVSSPESAPGSRRLVTYLNRVERAAVRRILSRLAQG